MGKKAHLFLEIIKLPVSKMPTDQNTFYFIYGKNRN